MDSLQQRLGVLLALLLAVSLSACTYDSALTDLECENEGDVDGDRVCRDGVWVEYSGGDTGGEDTKDATPPEDTSDVEPPEDTTDTVPTDTEDASTEDVADTEVEDAQDSSTVDVEDTTVEDSSDATADDVEDSANDASDVADPDTDDAGDSSDTADSGGPCYTADNITSVAPLGYWTLDAPNPNGDYPNSGSAAFGPAKVSSESNADPTNVSGVTSNAVEMDGDDDYLRIEHHPDMLIPTGTIVFWMKVDAFSGTQGLWSKDASGNSTGGHMTLEVRGDQKVYVRIQSDDESNYTLASQTLQPDQWIHVALTFGTSSGGRPGSELYIDGIAVAQLQYQGGLASNIMGEKARNEEPIGLGVTTVSWNSGDPSAWPDSNEELDGFLDEVALFDQRLTPQDIDMLANRACQ